jgi:hypothetical protein
MARGCVSRFGSSPTLTISAAVAGFALYRLPASNRTSGIISRAATGSAHFTCQMASIASPAKAMSER